MPANCLLLAGNGVLKEAVLIWCRTCAVAAANIIYPPDCKLCYAGVPACCWLATASWRKLYLLLAPTLLPLSVMQHTHACAPADRAADCLLLAGNCIVEEAVLTGESTPQWKLAVGGGGVSPNEHLHIKSHRQHVLFGGTKVLQHTGDKAARIRTPDGGCLAVVLRTGGRCGQVFYVSVMLRLKNACSDADGSP
jgi:hypothetical protein